MNKLLAMVAICLVMGSGCAVKETVQSINGHNRRMAARERSANYEKSLNEYADTASKCVITYAVSRADSLSPTRDIYVAALDACASEVDLYNVFTVKLAREKVRGRLSKLPVDELAKQYRDDFYRRLEPSTVRAVVEARHSLQKDQEPKPAGVGVI